MRLPFVRVARSFLYSLSKKYLCVYKSLLGQPKLKLGREISPICVMKSEVFDIMSEMGIYIEIIPTSSLT